MAKKELLAFLKVIKDNADLPPDDSDIAHSLWIKNFTHIRYFAIDEFLESETGEESVETIVLYSEKRENIYNWVDDKLTRAIDFVLDLILRIL